MKALFDQNELSLDAVANHTYTALKSLMAVSLNGQMAAAHQFDRQKHSDSHLCYLKEYCTIRMCTARRSGHTTAICRMAIDYFDKAIFLAFNFKMSSNIHHRVLDLLVDEKIDKVTPREISTTAGHAYLFGTYGSQSDITSFRFPRDTEANVVFVDGTFNLNSSTEDKIYKTCEPFTRGYPQRFFVFVQ